MHRFKCYLYRGVVVWCSHSSSSLCKRQWDGLVFGGVYFAHSFAQAALYKQYNNIPNGKQGKRDLRTHGRYLQSWWLGDEVSIWWDRRLGALKCIFRPMHICLIATTHAPADYWIYPVQSLCASVLLASVLLLFCALPKAYWILMCLPVAWMNEVPLALLRNTGKPLIPFAFSTPSLLPIEISLRAAGPPISLSASPETSISDDLCSDHCHNRYKSQLLSVVWLFHLSAESAGSRALGKYK